MASKAQIEAAVLKAYQRRVVGKVDNSKDARLLRDVVAAVSNAAGYAKHGERIVNRLASARGGVWHKKNCYMMLSVFIKNSETRF